MTDTTSKRSGVEAWVRQREKINRTTGSTSYAEIFKYNWHDGKQVVQGQIERSDFEDAAASSRFLVGCGEGGLGY